MRCRNLMWLVVVALVFVQGPWARGAEGRPNVLVLIADDMSWCHTGYAGDPAIRTPAMDRLAREGVVFERAHCVAASCTPSRAALLTGRPIWQLGHGAVLWGTLPVEFRTYPELLGEAGYAVGHAGKGWGPGDHRAGGREENPAGPRFKSIEAFLKGVGEDQPFCFWFGSRHPHRGYKPGSGIAAGIDPAQVRVPPMLPDVPEVRSDVATYLNEIQKFDAEIGQILGVLEEAGRLENTLVVLTSDNGMPFPRGKTTLYEYGTHMPLVIRWPGKAPAGRRVSDFVSLIDLCPTFLEAAGVKAAEGVVGRSLVGQLRSEASGQIDPGRDRVYLGNERHAAARAGMVGYPRRAVRTAEYLYIRNYEPNRWPAGGPPVFGDIDPHTGVTGQGLAKDYLLAHKEEPGVRRLYEASFGKNPAEELYDLKADPAELHNVAEDPAYAGVKRRLRADLGRHLKETGDPRAEGSGVAVEFDEYPMLGIKPGVAAETPAE